MNQEVFEAAIALLQSEHQKGLYWVGGFLAPSLIAISLIGKVPKTRFAVICLGATLISAWVGAVFALLIANEASLLETGLRHQQLAWLNGGEILAIDQAHGSNGKVTEVVYDEAKTQRLLANSVNRDGVWTANPLLYVGVWSGIAGYVELLVLLFYMLNHHSRDRA